MSKIPTPIDLYNVAGVYIVLTIGAVIAFIFLFLETKAPTWFQGRCFGCFAKEEVFFKVKFCRIRDLLGTSLPSER